MKKVILFFLAALVYTGCSAPKYSYHFDTYDYNSGKKQSPATAAVNSTPTEQSPLLLDKEVVTAQAQTPVTTPVQPMVVDKKAIMEKLAKLTPEERKELRQNLKTELKKMRTGKADDSIASVKANKAWDSDLKMAAIFGVVALVLTALYGVSPVFWIIGVVALIIALIFLIKWLARQ